MDIGERIQQRMTQERAEAIKAARATLSCRNIAERYYVSFGQCWEPEDNGFAGAELLLHAGRFLKEDHVAWEDQEVACD